MATVREIYDALDKRAPFVLQMDFDNAGLLVGRGEAEVRRALVSLDVTPAVVREAREWGAELIVAHHPIIFHPARSITDETTVGRVVLDLAEAGIAAICAHTNLDAVAQGVNDALAHALGLEDVTLLTQDGTDPQGRPYGVGRVGSVPAQDPAQFAAFVKAALGANGVRMVDGGRPIRRVAVGGGACGGMVPDALAKGCDAFVTADVKYDVFLEAQAQGLTLIDAGHYPTENVVCPVLEAWLGQDFPDVETRRAQTHQEPYAAL